MRIKIIDNDTVIESLDTPTDLTVNKDTRVEVVKTIDGVAILDGGTAESGDSLSTSFTLSDADFSKLKAICNLRKLVDIELENAKYSNMLIILKSYSYIDKFQSFKKVNVEMWSV